MLNCTINIFKANFVVTFNYFSLPEHLKSSLGVSEWPSNNLSILFSETIKQNEHCFK